jgi:hypothetical protein
VLAVAVLLAIFFAGRGDVGYARVIDPGELEVLRSATWVRATTGEILHPGDWLRNPVPDAAKIQLHNSAGSDT